MHPPNRGDLLTRVCSLISPLGGGRYHRYEIRTARNVALVLRCVGFADWATVDVEPRGDARRFESGLDLLNGRQILAGAGDEHGAVPLSPPRRRKARRGATG